MTLAKRIVNARTIRAELQSMIRTAQCIAENLSLMQRRKPVRTPVGQCHDSTRIRAIKCHRSIEQHTLQRCCTDFR